MLYFSVFELFSGWVLLSSETLYLDNTAQPFFKGKALGTRLGSDEGLWRICRLYLVIYT